MFTIVVYERETRKVILCLPLRFTNDTEVNQETTILHKGYGYEVFANREPVFYEDENGDMCLKENCFAVKRGDSLWI